MRSFILIHRACGTTPQTIRVNIEHKIVQFCPLCRRDLTVADLGSRPRYEADQA